MNRNKPFVIGKIYSNEQYTMDLLDGKLFINPLAVFGIGKLSSTKKIQVNSSRDDLNEGLITNTSLNNQISNNRIISFFQDVGGIPREANSVGEIDSHFINENILCFSALFYDDDCEKLTGLNHSISGFSDQKPGLAIVIYNVQEFIRRIIHVLSESLGSPYWIAYGLVDYDFSVLSNTETDEFTKEESYGYQQEFRIAINLGSSFRVRTNTQKLKYDSAKGTLLLNIGSIRDIAFVLPTEDYISLRFPKEYIWVKSTPPMKVCTFYPPVRNEVSYICPLIRIADTTFVSENKLYPLKRNPNAFRINQKQCRKTLLCEPANDAFFLEVLELYVSRMLDVYKSKNNQAELELLLTAVVNYMHLLGIAECAGIRLFFEENTLQVRYEDLDLHDMSLLDGMSYLEVQKGMVLPKPSDFAVLVTLSDQTQFDEYEYNGKKYVRVQVSRNGELPSGKKVEAGEIVWVESSKVKYIGC